MEKIIEIKINHSTCYEKYRGDEKELYKRITVIGLKKEIGRFVYFLILDSQGLSIKNAFNYINVELGRASFKKRELAFTAIKFLYSFCELFNVFELTQMSRNEIKKLLAFLGGGDFLGMNILTEGLTIRSNGTVKSYIGVYRAYFDFLGIKPNLFMESKSIIKRSGGTGFFAHTQTVEIKKYVTSPTDKIVTEVPSYISFEQYKIIIAMVKEEYTIRELIICRLMYEYGLRIGEILGLTLEDFINESITKEKGNFKIFIRNRVTDKPYQYAKGCMKVISGADYERADYHMKGFGYQEIIITESVGLLIQEYIDSTRSPFILSEITSSNLIHKNIADKVTERNEFNRNQYIIISKNYTPITSTAWNLILKSIFIKVGIEVDRGKKRENLNHRFRHGFAMFKITEEGYDQLKLSKAMRHNDSSSINYYFKPTEDDRKRYANETERILKNGGVDFED